MVWVDMVRFSENGDLEVFDYTTLLIKAKGIGYCVPVRHPHKSRARRGVGDVPPPW